jgi:hypothetical protein
MSILSWQPSDTDGAARVCGDFASTDASASVASLSDSPVNDVEDSDTLKCADPGCSAATGGRGEAGHSAQNPRCPPGHYRYGAVRAVHHAPRSGGGH